MKLSAAHSHRKDIAAVSTMYAGESLQNAILRVGETPARVLTSAKTPLLFLSKQQFPKTHNRGQRQESHLEVRSARVSEGNF